MRIRIWLIAFAVCLILQCKQAAQSPVPPAPAKNILLITIDTLRADALSVYGNKTRTPFFEDFAKHAVVFDHAFTCAPITLPAHTSLMTGLYPPSHGVRHNGVFKAPRNLPSLARLAKDHGYQTSAVVGGFPLAARFGLNAGFDYYDDNFSEPNSTEGTFEYAERNAESVRLSAQAWASKLQNNKPFFLWVHFYDPHHPYKEHGFDSLPPYLQEVLYVDQQLQELFRFLTQKGLLKQTITIILSDHGEAFGEHGEISHSLFVYDTTLRIPLLISVPEISAGRRTELARIIDVAPTLMDIMKWKSPAELEGASLLPLLNGKSPEPHWNFAETLAPAIDFGWSPIYSIQNLQGKYIQAPHPEFYDLQKDPQESINLIGSRDVKEYREKIDIILKKASGQGASYSPTQEEKERLRSLGYISGNPAGIRPDAPDPKDRLQIAKKIAELSLSSMPLTDRAKAYAEIVSAEPNNPLLLLRYAEILLQLHQNEKAESIFRRVVNLHYPGASAYNGLAAALYYLRRDEEAIKVLSDAIQSGVADGETYYNYAEFLFNRGDRDQAFLYYQRSMENDYLPAFYRKAKLLTIMGQYSDALKLLESAENRRPYEAQVNQERGMIYSRMNQWQQAIQEFQKALQKNPARTELVYNIGVSYYRMGDPKRAAESLQKFLSSAPPESKAEQKTARQILAELRKS